MTKEDYLLGKELTKKEKLFFDLWEEGHCYMSIAEMYNVSSHNVWNHVRTACRKKGIENKYDAKAEILD